MVKIIPGEITIASLPTYKTLVKIWDMRVALLEQFEEEVNGKMCDGCEAPCEKSPFIVLLTEEEYLSGKYPIKIIPMPELKKNFFTQNAIGMAMGKEGCFFFKNGRCLIYENRPKACRIYDCRKDPRPEIKAFVKKRFK